MHWRGSETGTRRPRSRPQFPNLPRCPPARCSAPRAVRNYRPAPRYMRARARTHARTRHAQAAGYAAVASGRCALTARPAMCAPSTPTERSKSAAVRGRGLLPAVRDASCTVRCGAVRCALGLSEGGCAARSEAKPGHWCAGARSIVPGHHGQRVGWHQWQRGSWAVGQGRLTISGAVLGRRCKSG